ncbi:MAG: hypothetical protein ACE144_10235 [Thermodesulfobacteriota bacterium]
MRIIEYVVPLGSDGRRRTRHVRVGTRIVEFVVQYELEVNKEWYPVVRYDSSHGFAHRDKLSPKGEVTKEELPITDFNLALTFAEKDLRQNWQKYRAYFLKEMKKND